MLFLPFLFLFLISCSDNLLYNEATPHIFIDVLNHSDTVLVGETVRFQARINPSPEDVEYSWFIENKNSSNYSYSYSNLLFERKFMESGLYNVKFQAKDLFYDVHEINFFIRVSSKPVCGNLSLEIFQGSPTFEWNCIDIDDNGSLTYKFLLLNEYGHLRTDTTLTEGSLQLGYALQENDIIRLIATNKYGIETHLDSVWGSP
jgi:hypothetical protein